MRESSKATGSKRASASNKGTRVAPAHNEPQQSTTSRKSSGRTCKAKKACK